MTFDHRDSGTPASAWDATVDGAPVVELPDVTVPIVVLAAHPDDETLGVGGLLAMAAERGHETVVVIASDGEASHPASSTHAANELRYRRRAEAVDAVAVLAPKAELHLLGRPDGRLAEHVDDLVVDLDAILAEHRGAWLLAPWWHDGHPDHQACARAARRMAARSAAGRIWEYPIWAWHWDQPTAAGRLAHAALRRLVLPPTARQAKADARARYRSQTEALSERPGDEPIVSAAFAAHFARDIDVLIDTSVKAAG